MKGVNESDNTTSDTNASQTPRNSRGWPYDEPNPFVAFRRFADEQVSSILQSITGLPSTVSAPHPDNWPVFTGDNDYKDMMTRQRNGGNDVEDYTSRGAGSSSGDREDSSYDNTDRSFSRSSRSPREHDDPWHSQSWRKWCNGPSDFFGLEDHFFPLFSHLFHPHHRFFIPDMFEDSNSPTWPITYLMLSPYSPLHLERHAHYHNHRHGVFSSIMSSLSWTSNRDPAEPQWREAFEDLLRLENGKPMLDPDSLAVSKNESGKDWLQDLAKRGSLGERWKYVSSTDDHPWSGIVFSGSSAGRSSTAADSRETEKHSPEQADADNELDLYRRYLKDIDNGDRETFPIRGVADSPLIRLLLQEQLRQQAELELYRDSLRKEDEQGDEDIRSWLHRQQDELDHLPKDDEQGNEDTENWLDLVSGGNRQSVPETPKETIEFNRPESVSAPAQPRVVSTMTRTERVRLADGSIQIKTVKSKRFTDGREESDESVEVAHPPPRSDSQPAASDNKSKNGWFWKD